MHFINNFLFEFFEKFQTVTFSRKFKNIRINN